MQGYRILTSLRVYECIIMIPTCSIGHSVTVPGKALAGYNCGIGMYSDSDCKMQRNGILTPLCIVENKLCCRAYSIGHSVTVPDKALAGNNCCIAVHSIVDRQMQGDCILTALCIVENKVGCRACRIDHSITVPGKALAGD